MSARPAARSQGIRDHLERVLASKGFCRSERLRSFLRLIVEQSLDDPAAAIKEYHIATGAYGRPSTFDPRFDPIVRVEARRLRTKLAEYYHAAGRNDVFEISLPNGSYVPVIRIRASAAQSPEPDSEPTRSITVEPFKGCDASGAEDEFARGLTEEILHALDRTGLCLRAWQRHWTLESLSANNRGPGAGIEHDRWSGYAALQGLVRRRGNEIRVSVRLTEIGSGSAIWSSVYSREVANAFAAQEAIAGAIAAAVLREADHRRSRASADAALRAPEPLDAYLERRIRMGGLTSDEVLHAVEVLKEFAHYCPHSVAHEKRAP